MPGSVGWTYSYVDPETMKPGFFAVLLIDGKDVGVSLDIARKGMTEPQVTKALYKKWLEID
jgi:hypothetical protein